MCLCKFPPETWLSANPSSCGQAMFMIYCSHAYVHIAFFQKKRFDRKFNEAILRVHHRRVETMDKEDGLGEV